MKNTKIIKTSTAAKKLTAKNESNLGLRRGCQRNMLKGKKQ